MKGKVLIAAGLSILMAVGLLTGCSDSQDAKEDKQKNQDKAKGRYVEEELEMPAGEDEKPIGTWMEDGVLHLYTRMKSENSYTYYEYEYSDGNWSQQKEDTFLSTKVAEVMTDSIYYGQDGSLYALGIPLSEEMVYGSHVLKQSEKTGEWEDITPENLLKVNEDGYTARIVDVDVLSDGSLCIANGDNSQAETYRDGKKVFSCDMQPMHSNTQNTICASSEGLAVLGKDGKNISFYKGQDFSESGSVSPMENVSGSSRDETGMSLAPGKDGIWFCLTSAGIFRFQENGSIIETLMDGSYGRMGVQDISVVSFLRGESEDFYALYYDYGNTNAYYLTHYSYDADMSASTDKTLSVYSLKENATVRQAVSAFQNSNPDVKAEYSYAVGAEGKPASEQIRSLNTELLNGEGPDVIILDGLPVDSYVEKGILADLTEVMDEQSKEGGILENLGKAVEKDGKVYGIPARVGLPVIVGNEDTAKALESQDSFLEYLKANPESQIFESDTHYSVGKTLISTLYGDLINEKGTMDEKKLAELLEGYQQICTNMETDVVEKAFGYKTGDDAGRSIYFSVGSWTTLKNNLASVFEMQGIGGMRGYCHIIGQSGLEPETVNGYYVPYTIAGVSAVSKQQDLAKVFVETLLSDEVQDSHTEDGLPVTQTALDNMAAYSDSESKNGDNVIYISFRDPKTDETVEMSYGYPDGDMVKKYTDMLGTLEKPFLPNQIMMDAVMEGMENCYEGTKTAEEAAKSIVQKMDTYLSE